VTIKPPQKIREQRYKCEVGIKHDVVIPDIYYDGTISNLSRGGIYFESNELILPGDVISISVKKLNDEKITFEVCIIWKKDLSNSTYRFGYGAQSINPKESMIQISEQGNKKIIVADDKREYPRKIFKTQIRLKDFNKIYNGQIRDISRGGAYIATDSIFPIGKKIALNLSGKKTRKSIKLIGWIVRKDNKGFGITFDRRSSGERRHDIDRRKGTDRRSSKKPKTGGSTDQFIPKKSASEVEKIKMKHQPIF